MKCHQESRCCRFIPINVADHRQTKSVCGWAGWPALNVIVVISCVCKIPCCDRRAGSAGWHLLELPLPIDKRAAAFPTRLGSLANRLRAELFQRLLNGQHLVLEELFLLLGDFCLLSPLAVHLINQTPKACIFPAGSERGWGGILATMVEDPATRLRQSAKRLRQSLGRSIGRSSLFAAPHISERHSAGTAPAFLPRTAAMRICSSSALRWAAAASARFCSWVLVRR